MFLPSTYNLALLLMIISMLCWGSWANSMKLCPGYRFQLFYWDYVIGVLGGTLLWGLSFGSMGENGLAFLPDVASVSLNSILLAALGGVVFNIANLLLVAAIDVAGLAVAFPVGIGLALIVGAVSSYLVSPSGNPLFLFGGVALVMLAIVMDAVAYSKRESGNKAASSRGIVLSLLAGVLMGSFYPLVAKSMQHPPAPGPYAIAFYFALGVLISTVPANLILMRWPLDGKPPVAGSGYWKAPFGWHLAGMLGGGIWCTGTIANFVSSRAHLTGQPISPAVSYSIGQGATMISAIWGVFIWKEFAGAPRSAQLLLGAMFLFFLAGLGAIALAPLY